MRRPSVAIILAAVALFAATDGPATAARLITGAHVKNSSLTGLDIKNRSIGPSDLTASAAPGITSTVEVDGPKVPSGTTGTGDSVQSSKAECPAGTVVVGGGHDTGVRDFIGLSKKSGNGYFVIAINTSEFSPSHIQAQAICGRSSAPTPVLASASSVRRAESAALARFRRAFAGSQRVALKACSPGWKHAVLRDGSHKCLRAGQYCARRHESVYRAKGFTCRAGRLRRR